jgi:hypothetical protein
MGWHGDRQSSRQAYQVPMQEASVHSLRLHALPACLPACLLGCSLSCLREKMEMLNLSEDRAEKKETTTRGEARCKPKLSRVRVYRCQYRPLCERDKVVICFFLSLPCCTFPCNAPSPRNPSQPSSPCFFKRSATRRRVERNQMYDCCNLCLSGRSSRAWDTTGFLCRAET